MILESFLNHLQILNLRFSPIAENFTKTPSFGPAVSVAECTSILTTSCSRLETAVKRL